VPADERLDPLPTTGPVGISFAELFVGARPQRLRPGAVLFSEGDVSNKVILVAAGRLRLSSYGEDGRETVLGYRGPGDILGEFTAIDGEPHLATVTATESTEVLALPADAFVAGLEAHPELALGLLRAVVARLRDSDRKRIESGALNTVARVARRLVELAERDGETSSQGVMVTITQAELAGWAGCSREAANKALSRLSDRGLVVLGRGHLTVIDLDGLRARAG
jgi:CRP-like cAMP-binding protein